MTHIEAIKHYEEALKAAFPMGASGEVFEHWNKARIAIREAEKQEQPLPPLAIGVDVTAEGTSVVGFYRRPDDVMEMFYSQFHPHQNAAVAEPHKQEPVAWRWETHNGYAYSEEHYEGENGQPLYTHPQPKQPLTKPVAWYYETDGSKAISFAKDGEPNKLWQPLYTHPQPKAEQEPKRKPLTDKRLDEICLNSKSFQHGMRLVEAAHGIMGDQFWQHNCSEEGQIGIEKGQSCDWCGVTEPKREWVGLTDDDLNMLCCTFMGQFNKIDFIKGVEDKLKEKNA